MASPTGLVVSAVAAQLVWAAVAVAAAGPIAPALPPVAAVRGSTRLLDVPYLPQTEDLCGGAAVAMVLRYWGERQVYPEDFEPLVDRGASGIRTDVLVADVSRRGWRSFPLDAGTGSGAEWVRQHIDRGRPIVALIEVRPNRYHYVVIVASTGEQVVVHDPARGPFRVMAQTEFDHAWLQAGRWALLLLPPEGAPSEPETGSEAPAIDTRPVVGVCGGLVRQLVELAQTGEVGRAETGLLAAVRICPDDPASWRALSGTQFLQSRWAEASASAEQASLLDPGDAEGWDLLATSRFLNNEADAALDAWNRTGRPAVDLVRVEGVERTRVPVVVALIDLPPRTVLTAERYGRAARRLSEIPSATLTSLRYRPIEGGLAEMEASVVERPTVPHGPMAVAAAASRAWLQREARLDVAAPAGSGELWTVAWRWWEARPRLGVALAVPAVSWLPGVTTIEAFWERSSYEAPGAGRTGTVAIRHDERRRAALSFADWASSRIRWKTGVAFDRWAKNSHASVDGALDVRLARDRLSLGVDAAAWAPIGSGGRFATGAVSSAWRSTRETSRPSWLILVGLAAASADAPFDLWPGAGTGHARTPLLRAHPLLDAGVVRGPVFGRRVAHGTVEYQRPLAAAQGGAMRIAAFADTARAWRRLGDDDRPVWHTDVGVGIRAVLPGNGGTLRADMAAGLRDGRVTLSTGWQAPWPSR